MNNQLSVAKQPSRLCGQPISGTHDGPKCGTRLQMSASPRGPKGWRRESTALAFSFALTQWLRPLNEEAVETGRSVWRYRGDKGPSAQVGVSASPRGPTGKATRATTVPAGGTMVPIRTEVSETQ